MHRTVNLVLSAPLDSRLTRHCEKKQAIVHQVGTFHRPTTEGANFNFLFSQMVRSQGYLCIVSITAAAASRHAFNSGVNKAHAPGRVSQKQLCSRAALASFHAVVASGTVRSLFGLFNCFFACLMQTTFVAGSDVGFWALGPMTAVHLVSTLLCPVGSISHSHPVTLFSSLVPSVIVTLHHLPIQFSQTKLVIAMQVYGSCPTLEGFIKIPIIVSLSGLLPAVWEVFQQVCPTVVLIKHCSIYKCPIGQQQFHTQRVRRSSGN